jgi:Fic/DOC family
MTTWPDDPIGAAWLAMTFAVEPMAGLPVISRIGGRRATHEDHGRRTETYVEAMRPDATFVRHLQFHLRHEVPQFEFLARLFAQVGPQPIQDWIDAEPTGAYARRSAFLYEWLTGQRLQPPAVLGGNYVDAIDSRILVAASADRRVRVPRWRVNDNLPGTRHFCPMVQRTAALELAAGLDIPGLLAELSRDFGEALLYRSAVWMTLRESRASFAIEGEADQADRVQRFADVMARRTGIGDLPLQGPALAEIQRDILGPRRAIGPLGLRQSPVFVGETVRFQEVIHYVAPPPQDLADMLEGLQAFVTRTEGQSSVLRSAVVSFAFVYIHPLADGNGRVHRFLINDILRRDGVIADPVILPVSAVISADAGEKRAYDSVLDRVSKPLMQAVRGQVDLKGPRITYPDGVVSDLQFSGDEQARPLWRYPDLGAHVIYLSRVLRSTITEQMREESRYLRSHARARAAIKNLIEMPDPQADRLLRSIEQGGGRLSNVLVKELPLLAEPGLWEDLVAVVRAAFADDSGR